MPDVAPYAVFVIQLLDCDQTTWRISLFKRFCYLNIDAGKSNTINYENNSIIWDTKIGKDSLTY